MITSIKQTEENDLHQKSRGKISVSFWDVWCQSKMTSVKDGRGGFWKCDNEWQFLDGGGVLK